IGRGTVAEEALAWNPDAGAAQAVGYEPIRVITQRTIRGGRIGRVEAGDDRESESGVGNRSGERANGVLALGDGNNSRPAGETNRGLDADDAAHGTGTQYRSVGFGTDRERSQAGSHRRGGA